ncbi:MAG: hypothetical protein M9894_24845 [Planctomycetes bacterium]|nr:hypothetical protein [Planctomycetota bacterium]
MSVGARAVAAGLVTEDELAAAERAHHEQGVTLDDALVQLNLLTEDQVVGLRAAEAGLPAVFPYARSCDRRLLEALPAELLRRHDALPLARDGDELVVALPEAPAAALLDDLARAAGRPVRPVLAGRHRVRRILGELLGRGAPAPPAPAAPDSAALGLFYGQLARAVDARAEAVRFDVIGGELVVRARLGDQLVLCAREPAGLQPAILARARTLLGEPGAREPDRPLVGVVPARLARRDALLEVSVLPARSGASVLVRLLRDGPPPALDALDLPPERLERLRRLGERRRGLVLVAAPAAADARALAAALAAAGDPLARAVVCLVQEPHAPEPLFQHLDRRLDLDRARWTEDVLRHRPDVLVAEAEHPDGPAVRALARAARAALVVATLEAPDAVEGLILLAERVDRPALLARVLAGLVTPPGDPLEPSPALREALERRAGPAELRLAARGARAWT